MQKWEWNSEEKSDLQYKQIYDVIKLGNLLLYKIV